MKDKNGNPLIDAYGEQVLDGSKTFLVAKMHPVIQEMRAEADTFNSTSFPGERVLIAEMYSSNIADLANTYGPPGKPEFQLPMDTQVGFIDKLDVAALRQSRQSADRYALWRRRA